MPQKKYFALNDYAHFRAKQAGVFQTPGRCRWAGICKAFSLNFACRAKRLKAVYIPAQRQRLGLSLNYKSA